MEGVLWHISPLLLFMLETAYIADTPRHSALLAGCGSLVGLAFDAKVHDVISANGTVVYHDVPCP